MGAPDIEALAREQFGEPNRSLSTARQLRFGRKGSIAVEMEGDKAGVWFDFDAWQGGKLGEFVANRPPRSRLARARRASFAEDDAKRTERAAAIYNMAQPVQGTLAETYLASRGLTPLDNRLLRFHPHCPNGKATAPAMVAPLYDAETGEFRAVHRTLLTHDGEKVGKKVLGPAAGTMVPLSDPATVGDTLGITEGIEDGLSILAMGRGPVWATYCAGGIRNFPIVSRIMTLTIWADADFAGLHAAQECARRWAAAGRTVHVVPPVSGDWNDMWRQQGAA